MAVARKRMAKKVLQGKIALVAGATRGAGRGIAVAFGEAGATVYCTGRSSKGRPATPGRPETIEETAELVTAAGGRGIAVRVEHTEPQEVKKLVAGIKRRHKGLDILVNDIWGGDPQARRNRSGDYGRRFLLLPRQYLLRPGEDLRHPAGLFHGARAA